MPANPLRRRGKLSDAAKLAAADAAISLAKDRLTPGSRKRGRGKALLIGGAVVAVGVAAMTNRRKVAGLIGTRSSVPEPPPPPAPPQPANVDVSGPPANTATPVPAPEAVVPDPIDERAEEAAAAAEAAAIGGEVSDYASSDPTLPADPAERPLAEAGGGEAEGQEQAEALLEENLQPPEGQGEIAAQARLDEVIEQADRPDAGETLEPRAPISEPDPGEVGGEAPAPDAAATPEAAPPPEAAPEEPAAAPGEPAPPEAAQDEAGPAEDGRKDDDGPTWQTWSGISRRP
jgi:hypothetical protein